MCINITGSLTDYFECTRGVRQGDPLSPLLFVLAAEGLSKILHRGAAIGLFQGLGPLLPGGQLITHLQYTDDTLILLHPNPESLLALKWALIAFEHLSGLKINYAKSDIHPINLSASKGSHLASLLGCQLGSLPFTYLGVLIHWRKPGRSTCDALISKVPRKLSNWRGRFFSLEGRLVLLNSVLSAVTLYMLSIHKLSVWVRKQLDSIRLKFL